MMCGGTGAEKEADKEVQALCDELKDEILQKAGKNGAELFKALKYKSQVVAGTNFFVTIQVHPNGECVHARIFRPLPCNRVEGGKTCQLHSVQTGKKVADEVNHF